MTIGSPVGVVTTYTFTPDGTLQAFVIPFHDGPIRVKIAATLNAAAAAASITIKAQQATIDALLDALGGSDG